MRGLLAVVLLMCGRGAVAGPPDGAGCKAAGAAADAAARAGKGFTPAGKRQVIDDNKKANGGQTVCQDCKQSTVPAQKSVKDVTPPKNETQVDHIQPKSKGGSGLPDNGQVLCRDCNRKKSDK